MPRAPQLDAFLLGVTVVSATACTVPVMHPFRTHEGPGGRMGITVLAGAERRGGCDNIDGCKPGGAGGFSFLNLDGRWGHKLSEHVGIMGGLNAPSMRNSKSDSAWSLMMGYGALTLQTPAISVGAGPEIGAKAIGASTGIDLQVIPLFGTQELSPHLLGVGGYFRYITPYERNDVHTNGRVPSWDVGGDIRIGPAIVQYSFYRQTSGVIDYVIYETSVYAQSWHTIFVGIEANADTFDLASPASKAAAKAAAAVPPKPVRMRFVGCDQLCESQSRLPCKISIALCSDQCRWRKLPHQCWDADDELLKCQARGIGCDGDSLRFPACDVEQNAFDDCLRQYRATTG